MTCDIFSAAQRIVGQNSQKGMLACILPYFKIQMDVVAHPGTSGILHFTYYALGHTKSLLDILTSKVEWVLNSRYQTLRTVNLYTVTPTVDSC